MTIKKQVLSIVSSAAAQDIAADRAYVRVALAIDEVRGTDNQGTRL